MKKIYMILLTSLAAFNLTAQVLMEHAYDDQSSVNVQVIRLENSGQKICLVNRLDSTYYQYVFYNPDYSDYTTVSIDLAPLFIISDYNSPSLYISFIAENVFDTDNDIDMMGQLTYYDDDFAEYAQVLIFNQDGSILFKSDVDNTNAWLFSSTAANSSLVSSLTNTDAGAKMILDVFYFNKGQYSYDVYSLPGKLPVSLADNVQTDERTDQSLKAYPVPARELIYMDYRLNQGQRNGTIEITDARGQLIEKIPVGEGRGMVTIPVDQFQDGVFLYKLNTGRGVSRSGKMIVVH